MKCKQCSEFKDSQFFRKYPHRKGYYKICKRCERINNRYKYLVKKKHPSDSERKELDSIEELYDTLEKAGNQVPVRQQRQDMMREIDELKASVKPKAEKLQGTPAELQEWLEKDLSEFTPEYLQDELYYELQKKYRPQIGIDDDMNPKYDDTHKEMLDKIAERFDKYEDEYYG